MQSVTVELPDRLHEELKLLSERQRRPIEELMRECLSRYAAVNRFRELRGQVLPFAEAQGLLTDDDAFEAIS